MGFYEELSKYYDIIFPLEKSRLDFISSRANKGSRVLDIGCGTGNYSIALGELGYIVDGIDLDGEMIEKAKGKSKEKDIRTNFTEGNMLDVDKIFDDKLFNLVFSIGNSIVHLENEVQIKEFLHKAYRVMSPNATIILQIVNYDRILDHNIKHLPTISREQHGIKFVRNYRYNEEDNKISFNTEIVKVTGNKEIFYHNSVKLYPLRSLSLRIMLEKVGFRNIRLYGNFLGEDYNESSFATIVQATK